jgi:hypothetical protein
MLISGYGNRPGIGQAMLQAQMAGNQKAQVDEQERARKQQLYLSLADMIIKGIPMAAGAVAGGAAGGLGGAFAGMAGMQGLMPQQTPPRRRRQMGMFGLSDDQGDSMASSAWR